MQTVCCYSPRQLNSSASLQTHWPRTGLYRLLMNSTASSACCCGQVISLNSGKDQRQHFLLCPLVMTSQREVTSFTRVGKAPTGGFLLLKLGQRTTLCFLLRHQLAHGPCRHAVYDNTDLSTSIKP